MIEDKINNKLYYKEKGSIPIIFIVILSIIYFVSQFYRSSLGVISIDLMQDFVISPEVMGRLGGVFFLSFAISQIPLGILLDKYNPVKIIMIMLFTSIIGSIVFSYSVNINQLFIGRALIGIGCAVCFMGPLVLISKWTSKDRFGEYAGYIMSLGGLGGLVATSPLAIIVAKFGWRDAFYYSSFLVCLVMLLIWLFLPFKESRFDLNNDKKCISLREIIKDFRLVFSNRDFLLMLPMSIMGYASFASVLTLWGAPYLSDVYSLELIPIGNVLMIMAIAWIIGAFVYGRLTKTINLKKIVIFGALMTIIGLFLLSVTIEKNQLLVYFLFVFCGFNGAFTVTLLSHYRVLFPAHMIGRVLTTANLFNFAGVFFVQWLTGEIILLSGGTSYGAPKLSYSIAFISIGLILSFSLVLYLFTRRVCK